MFRFRPCGVLVALLTVACTAPNRVQRLTDFTIPVRVAVLPPSGGNLEPGLAEDLRIAVGNALEQRGYVKLDDAWVDQRLTRAGYMPWRRDWLPVDEATCAFGIANGIDGLVLLESFDAEHVTSAVYNERSIDGRIRVLDAGRGRTTWIFDVGSLDSGGVLLQSGQVFDAFAGTVANAEERSFAVLAARLALEVASDLPANTERLPVAPRPRIDRVAALAGDGAAVEVEVEGTADCRAFASLPDSLGRYPLVERAPGRYVGTLPTPTVASRVVAVLRDRIGASSRPVEVDVAVPVATEGSR